MRKRLKIWWELVKPGWEWAVVAPITLIGAIGAVRDEIIAPAHPELYRLFHWLPDWSWQTYLLLVVVIWLLFVLEAAFRAISRRDLQLQDRSQKREKRLAIAKFLKQGHLLEDRYFSSDKPQNTEVESWYESVQDFLSTGLDRSYVSRFRTKDGIRYQGSMILSAEQNQYLAALQLGSRRLAEFLKEISND
jgi:hypothetical protein